MVEIQRATAHLSTATVTNEPPGCYLHMFVFRGSLEAWTPIDETEQERKEIQQVTLYSTQSLNILNYFLYGFWNLILTGSQTLGQFDMFTYIFHPILGGCSQLGKYLAYNEW
jgi:hypothetical protein